MVAKPKLTPPGPDDPPPPSVTSETPVPAAHSLSPVEDRVWLSDEEADFVMAVVEQAPVPGRLAFMIAGLLTKLAAGSKRLELKIAAGQAPAHV